MEFVGRNGKQTDRFTALDHWKNRKIIVPLLSGAGSLLFFEGGMELEKSPRRRRAVKERRSTKYSPFFSLSGGG